MNTRFLQTLPAIIIAGVVLVVFFQIRGNDVDSRTPEERIRDLIGPTPDFTTPYDITYRIIREGSSGNVDLDWNVETRTAEQADDVVIGDDDPWSRTITVTAGTFARIEASMDGRASSETTIRCEIEVDGEVFKTSEAEGPWANVLCSGTIGR